MPAPGARHRIAVTSNVAIAGTGRHQVRDYAGAVARNGDRERLAIGFAVVATALLPLLRPAGPGGTGPIDLLIALAVIAGLLWVGGTGRQIRLPYALPIGLILLGGALGAISGPIPVGGLMALIQDVAILIWFWVVINIASSPERLQVILRAWAYAAIGWAVVLLGSMAAGINGISGQTEAEGVRTALTFGNPNLAGNYFFISIMIVWAIGRPQQRLARLASYTLLLAALVSTGSNGALIAVVVGVTLASILAVYRRAGLAAATTALAVVVLAGVVVASQVSLADVQSRASRSSYAFVRDGLGRSGKTASDRGQLFREGVWLYQTSGVLGTGPGSTKARLKDEHASRPVEAHNDFLAALNERGILGLLGVLLLVGGLGLQSLWLAISPASARIGRAVRPNALAGAVAGTLIAMTATEYLHVRHVWTLFAIVVAAVLVAKE
jgi:O-Antigen ligase